MAFEELRDNWLTVYKLNERGEEVWRYNAEIIEHGANFVCVRALFVGRRDEVRSGFMVFRRGDVMTEWFFSDRWYNIFRVQDGANGALKGFYCNITRPALLSEEVVTAEDLALDVLVAPNGEITLLDEEEFEAMPLSAEDRTQAWAAVEQIKQCVVARTPPFDELGH